MDSRRPIRPILSPARRFAPPGLTLANQGMAPGNDTRAAGRFEALASTAACAFCGRPVGEEN